MLGLMMGSPSVTTPASGAIVAVATTFTADVRIPPKTRPSESGSSTRRRICGPVMPIPRAASTASGSTSRTPTYAFVRIGGIASSVSASATFMKPAPRNAKNTNSSAMAGTARPMFETLMARNAARRVWPNHRPMGSATAQAIAIATRQSLRCSQRSSPLAARPPTSPPPRPTRGSTMKSSASPNDEKTSARIVMPRASRGSSSAARAGSPRRGGRPGRRTARRRR